MCLRVSSGSSAGLDQFSVFFTAHLKSFFLWRSRMFSSFQRGCSLILFSMTLSSNTPLLSSLSLAFVGFPSSLFQTSVVLSRCCQLITSSAERLHVFSSPSKLPSSSLLLLEHQVDTPSTITHKPPLHR